MDIQTLHSIKSKFVSREVGNELILVPLTGNVAQMSEMFTLNETAKIIWENMNENTSIDVLEKLITDTFSIDKETASKDIRIFFNQLEKMLRNC